eukprot:1351940-Amorphochlora_amoeboformis.AAC.1
MDPTEAERGSSDFGGSLLLAYMPSLQQITYISQKGTIDSKVAQDMVKLCSEGCSKLHSLMRKCLVEAERKRQAKLAREHSRSNSS